METNSKPHLIRLEDGYGIGAYRGEGAIITDEFHFLNDRQIHPLPEDDSLLWKNAKDYGYNLGDIDVRQLFHYGFENIEILRRWFYNDKMLEEYSRSDYSIVKYEGEVYHGRTQSIILSESMELVGKIEIKEIL